MSDQPPIADKPPAGPPGRRPILLGAAIGAAPALAGALFFLPHDQGPKQLTAVLWMVSLTLWPLASLVLACIRSTRRFGLGMLLGVGFGWLAMAAICGGRLR